MDYIRIIPCLDIKDGRVVKGIHFVNLRDAGDPVENARLYEAEGADELAFLDITATVEGRRTTLELVKQVVAAITLPLTVGGGVQALEDVERLLAAGAAKVGINTAAVKRPDLVAEVARAVGSRRLVVAIDARRHPALPSGYEVVTHGGRTSTGLDAIVWAQKCRDLGAGEILPTSMDTDGVKGGYDLELTRKIKEATGLPVIASGGAGTLEHLYQGVIQGKADALLAASIFHFREVSIRQAKEYLHGKGIPVRL
jgi:cyclase